MFIRFLCFLIGFGLVVASFTHMILFLNLLVIGYTFEEYVNFIIRSPIFYAGIIGFIMLNLSIFIKEVKYELHL